MKFTLIARSAIWEGACSAKIQLFLMIKDASHAPITNKVVHSVTCRKLALSVMDVLLDTTQLISINA
jgi:hypothetical protein